MSLQLNKVLISDAVDASCRQILEDNGVSVDYKPGLSKDELLATIKVRLVRPFGWPRGQSRKVSPFHHHHTHTHTHTFHQSIAL